MLAFLFCASACRKAPEAAGAPLPEVLVTRAVARDVPVYRQWLGNLDGAVNTQVRARVDGYLVAQNYKDGSPVKAGDLLFEIDPRPLKAALDQACGDLARAEASEKLAAVNLKRAEALYTGKVISAQERDTAIANAGTARADVTAQRAAVETAALNLDFARITAPVDGIAGIANAQIGDLVGPGSLQNGPLATVSTVDPIKASFTVTEQDYLTFARRLAKPGARREIEEELQLEIILADGSVYPHRGTFDYTDRQVDPATGSMRVVAVFANPGAFLRPGLFCRVRARTGMVTGAALIPQRAVMEVQGTSQAMVVNGGGVVSIRPVELGESRDGWRVILKGVRVGETVVVEGLQKARDGTRVAPKDWSGQPPPVP